MPDADTLMQVGIARLLAARWGVSVAAPRVQVATRLLWRVLGWWERQPAGRNCALTLAVGADSAIKLYGGAEHDEGL